MSEREEKEDTMTQTGGDRRVYQYSSAKGRARRAEAEDVLRLKEVNHMVSHYLEEFWIHLSDEVMNIYLVSS